MTWFYIIAAVAAATWLAASVCGGLAVRRGLRQPPGRFAGSLVLSLVALGFGYLGVNSHIRYSQTVNGRGWSVDSRWLFWLPLALGTVGLSLAIWRRFKSPRAAEGKLPPIITPAPHA